MFRPSCPPASSLEQAGRSADLSFALLARGFRSISASDGTIGRFVRIVMAPVACSALNECLTTRSSNEWNVSMTSRPPGASRAAARVRKPSSPSSSWLTQIRIAWNVRVAGSMRV
jgi:hypothetical protein